MSPHRGTNTLTAIIVDDELFGRENLKKIIEMYCPEIEILACGDSVVQAKEIVGLHNPDVVFLDITMPVLDGFDFLNECRDRTFMAVFVSAHGEYGIDAVKAGAVDYVLKPINIKELKQTVAKLVLMKSKMMKAETMKVETVHEKDRLVIPASHGFTVLTIDEIIRLEAEGCYTKIVMKDGKATVISRTLKDFEDAMPEKFFIRIHKTHLINLKYVRDYSNINGNFVTMTDGSKIEISRRKAPEFIQKIKAALNAL